MVVAYEAGAGEWPEVTFWGVVVVMFCILIEVKQVYTFVKTY